MALAIPTLETPIFPRRDLLPRRVMPRLMPRLYSYAARVRVHRKYAGQEADLIPKFAGNSTNADGVFHEYYVLFHNGNPEGFMDLASGAKEVAAEFENNVGCELTRVGWAQMDVYVDDLMKMSFPALTSSAGAQPGYTGFWIPKPT